MLDYVVRVGGDDAASTDGILVFPTAAVVAAVVNVAAVKVLPGAVPPAPTVRVVRVVVPRKLLAVAEEAAPPSRPGTRRRWRGWRSRPGGRPGDVDCSRRRLGCDRRLSR